METEDFFILAGTVPPGNELSREDIGIIAPLFGIRILEDGELFSRPGQVATETALILEGIVRHYTIDEQARERTTDFCREGEFTGSIETGRESGTQWLAAVGRTKLAVADSAQLAAAVETSRALQKLLSSTLLSYLAMKTRRETDLLSLDPDGRYAAFAKNFPDILDKVPQYLVASYLGMTPETLSRVRNRRFSKTRRS